MPPRPARQRYASDKKRNTSLSLSDEIEAALDERAAELGITRSAVAVEIFEQWLQLGRPPLERGFRAGWRAGFREFMNRVNPIGNDLQREFDEGSIQIPGDE